MIVITPENNELHFQLEFTNTNGTLAESRVVVDLGKEKKYLFPVKIDRDGVGKMRFPLLEELTSTSGTLTLEVIVDDVRFIPYESDVRFENFKRKTQPTEAKAKKQLTSINESEKENSNALDIALFEDYKNALKTNKITVLNHENKEEEKIEILMDLQEKYQLNESKILSLYNSTEEVLANII